MAADRSPYGSRPQVSVDGSPLPADIVPALVRVIVHTNVHLPGMFVLHFQDTQHDVLSRAGIKFGTTIRRGLVQPGVSLVGEGPS